MIPTQNSRSTTHFGACLGLGIALLALGSCGSSPTKPTVSLGTPQLALPTDGAQVANSAQPVTLVVQNATATGSIVPTYTIEIATDSAFAAKVFTRAGIAQGTNGQTAVTVDSLTPGKDYYWRASAQTGTTTGAFSGTFKFTVGAAVTLGAPTTVSPTNGSQTALRPTFTVGNASKQGTANPLTYQFDVSTTSTFASTVAKGTVAEGPAQTSFAPSTDLPANSTLFWRATGIDAASGVVGPPSATVSFTTGSALFSGIQPPGTNGHAVKGDNWQTQVLVSFHGVVFNSPTLDQQQIFDLMDKGMSPQGAIDWMHGNGYPTAAAYFSSVQVIGFDYTYLALINGRWDLVLRGE